VLQGPELQNQRGPGVYVVFVKAVFQTRGVDVVPIRNVQIMLGSKSVLVALERYSERVPWVRGGVIGVIFVTKVSIEFGATRHEGDGIETQTCL
jgi:lysozyme family protein